MALDYDTPRLDAADLDPAESLESLTAVKPAGPETIEEDEPETLELPGLDPVLEELQVIIIPPQRNEFICGSCFMIKHQAQRSAAGSDVCRECAD